MPDSCLACGSLQARPRFASVDRLYGVVPDTFQVVQCSTCGLERLAPRPAASELARLYPRDYWFDPSESAASHLAETYRRFVLRDHVRFVLRVWQDARSSRPLLDVGCGGGLLPGMLREHSVPALGLDFSASACHLASTLHGVPCIAGNLDDCPVRPGSLGVVTMFHVLEHVPNPARYLRTAHDLLAPGGRLVVQVPNRDSLQARLFGARWNGYDVPRHLTDFRASDLVRFMRAAGFRVRHEKHFSWRDNPAGFATSLAPSLDPMARRIRHRPTGWLHLASYFSLVLAAVPFALFEAAIGRGSSIMVEAVKE